MREPGAVLLVSCYELGQQPLALAWPAAFLVRAGFAPATLDVAVEPFDPERARRARVALVSTPMHTALRLAVGVAQRIRALNPGCHVAFFGHYAILNRDWLLSGPADSVLGGESEDALVTLVSALEAGDDDTVKAIGREGRPRIERLAFPVPRRSGLPPLHRYARLAYRGGQSPVATVEASRGCRHRCRHCPIPPVYGGRFFVVPREVVLADVRQAVDGGAAHLTFGDPDFLNGPRHALEVARAVHREFPALTFHFTAKVEHLLRQRRHLAELVDLGALFAVTAVESLSDTVLQHLDKGHTQADVLVVTRLARQAGLALRPTFIPFTPWTALADLGVLLDFVEDEGLVDHVDPVQYSLRLLVPPGSLLLDTPALQPHLRGLDAGGFHVRWDHPDPRVDALHERVAAAVAEAAETGEDPAVTFDRVRGLVAEGGLLEARAPVALRLRPDRARPPRLTEPWFC